MNKASKADVPHCKAKTWHKRLKVREERRKAKLNPEITPGYGKYQGWMS